MEQPELDEIDIGQLLLKIVRLISKYKIALVTFCILGAGGGLAFFSLKTPVYESSMMLRSNILTEAYSITLTDNLKKLIDNEGYDILSQKLNLSIDEASFLKNIKVESVETSGAEELSKNSIFLISVETTSNDILSNLEKGLMAYLENNEYVKKRIELNKNRNKILLQKVRADIREMDSLKNDFLKGELYVTGPGNNLALFDPTDIYAKIMLLNKEEISYLQNLELIDSIQLIEGFTPFKRPISPKRLTSIATGGLMGLLLIIGIIFILELRSYIRKLETT